MHVRILVLAGLMSLGTAGPVTAADAVGEKKPAPAHADTAKVQVSVMPNGVIRARLTPQYASTLVAQRRADGTVAIGEPAASGSNAPAEVRDDR